MVLLKKKRLGELLVSAGLITSEQLTIALNEQKRTGERLGNILYKLDLVSEDNMIEILGQQLGIRHVDLSDFLIDPQIIKTVSEKTARHYQVIPLYKEKKNLVVAMVDPLNVFAIDELRHETKSEILPMVGKEAEIIRAIDQYYGGTQSIEEAVKSVDIKKYELIEGEKDKLERLHRIAEEVPIIKLVNMIIVQAISDKASDIHIEPDENLLRIRFRIDGILYEVSNLPKTFQPAITSRIKIMADLDIAEKRASQDGRFQIKIGNRDVDVRLSTLPTIFGEKLAMRLLDKSHALLDLNQLGFSTDTLTKFKKVITKPHGIILVTGPTGSGKSTTLYAALNAVNSTQKNIITIEDPVEYQLSLINQVQVNPRTGITFASGLRSILRQDPDIIMVGEIRDQETAEIAIHAALTGHLVISTLHTNDASGAISRLIDMGIEPFLIASSLEGIVGQRLIRIICPSCKETYTPTPELIKELNLKDNQKYLFAKGKGCSECKQTGYKGRTGIFELITVNDQIKELIVAKSPSESLKIAAKKLGFTTLRVEGLKKVLKQITTVEEVLRVILDVAG